MTKKITLELTDEQYNVLCRALFEYESKHERYYEEDLQDEGVTVLKNNANLKKYLTAFELRTSIVNDYLDENSEDEETEDEETENEPENHKSIVLCVNTAKDLFNKYDMNFCEKLTFKARNGMKLFECEPHYMENRNIENWLLRHEIYNDTLIYDYEINRDDYVWSRYSLVVTL